MISDACLHSQIVCLIKQNAILSDNLMDPEVLPCTLNTFTEEKVLTSILAICRLKYPMYSNLSEKSRCRSAL